MGDILIIEHGCQIWSHVFYTRAILNDVLGLLIKKTNILRVASITILLQNVEGKRRFLQLS